MANFNRLKVVLAEQQKTGKWLAEQIGKSNCTVSKSSSVCRVLYSLLILLLQPISFSLIMKKLKIVKKDSRPKKHGSIVLICRRGTSTFQRPSR